MCERVCEESKHSKKARFYVGFRMRISRENFFRKKRAQRDDIADVLDDGGNRDDESLFTNYHQH